MKTKELIKLLQEADPTGECHVRMEGGTPVSVERTEGYYDGPYTYFDEDMNLTVSTKGEKVEIDCMDLCSFVEYHYSHFEKDRNTFEYIMSKIKVESLHHVEWYTKQLKKEFDEWKSIETDSFLESCEYADKMQKEGWTWFQDKRVDQYVRPSRYTYYHWKIFRGDGKPEGSCVHNTQGIIHNDNWERVDNNVIPGYYQWIKK